jgi:iron complex outermembrane receptor protein
MAAFSEDLPQGKMIIKLESVLGGTSARAALGAASLGLGWAGPTLNVVAQEAVVLGELSVASSAGSAGRAGQGVGLQKDLPAPYAGGQFARGGSLGILGTRDALNTPFSTVNFTQQVIQDQQARTAADTLVNDSSVRLTTGSNGFDDTFQIRGFPVQAQDVGLNGLYGLVSSNRVAAQYIERIEVLKGPGAFMYGIPPGGSVGGSINIVTKRALDLPFLQVTPQYISPGNFGVHVDASTRGGANKEWGIRFNGLGRTGEASINDGNWQTGLGAVALDYQGERLRWALDVITQNDDTKNFRPQITLRSDIPFIPTAPDARGNWYPGTSLQQRDNTVATFLEYDLTDWLTAYGGIGYRAGSNRQTFPDSRVAGFPGGADAFGNFQLINAYYDSYSSSVSGNVGLKARFDTGFINHSLNVVYTGFSREDGFAYTANTAAESVPSNIYRPAALPVVRGARLDPRRSSDTTLTSVAVADTMSFLDEAVLLTAGVRYQMVNQLAYNTTTGARTSEYDADATSPLAGLVIKPWQNVAVYANYAEGLTSGTIVGPGYANTGAILSPFKSDQQEVGIKIDWGTITTTAALFQISRPSQVRTASNTLAYDGEQRNQGLELSAFGAILPNLRGFASATFLRPELTKPANPAERGNDAPGVPDLSVSAGLEWDTPWVPGLSLNGRVIYTSGSYLTTANRLRFPDWARVDLGLRYATILNDQPITLRFNVENVADDRYWLTTGTFVTVASPRTFILSASVNF